jgi:hypothetical protein
VTNHTQLRQPTPWAATAIFTVGLALSTYLASLKWFGLPCLGLGCETVLHSAYGVIFGIPVSVFGMVLWLGAMFFPRLRVPCLLLLAGGSVYFTAVQVFVLGRICPFCLAHAGGTWLGLLLWRQAPSRHACWAGVILAAVAATITQQEAARTVREQARAAAALFAHPAALSWLGPVNRSSPVLVISLTCPSCLELLSEVAARNLSRQPVGPAVFLKIDASQRELAVTFAAAVESQGGGRDAFFTVFALLQTQKERVLSDPDTAARWLETVFPNAAGHRASAERQIDQNAAALTAANVSVTPLLIAAGRPPRVRPAPDDLFPAAN